jgi:hypothetical protein
VVGQNTQHIISASFTSMSGWPGIIGTPGVSSLLGTIMEGKMADKIYSHNYRKVLAQLVSEPGEATRDKQEHHTYSEKSTGISRPLPGLQ